MRSFAGAVELSQADLLAAPVHWPRPSALDVSIQALEGVGPQLAAAAAEAGIQTIGDVLGRFPHRHRDVTIRPLGELGEGETGTVLVEVLGSQPRPFRKRGLTITSVKVGDDSGHIRASWFNQPWVASKLIPGTRLLLTGKLTKRGFAVNEYEVVSAGGEEESRDKAPGPRVLSQGEGGAAGEGVLDPPPPAPPAAGGAYSRSPSHRSAESAEDSGLGGAGVSVGAERDRGAAGGAAGAPRTRGVGDAIRAAHFPEKAEEAEEALERIAFEELFLHQALLTTRKRRTGPPGPRRASARPASWSAAGSTRCRSSRPGTSSPPSTRSTPTSTPASRCSGC